VALRKSLTARAGIVADTLDAYINKYSSLVSYLADNATGAVPPSDPAPPDLALSAISLRVRGGGVSHVDSLTD
jgi:hypothetical protein